MRKVTMLATALIAVLALSVGAFAYPVVVGVHPLSTPHPAAPTVVSHPRSGDDNSTGNQTNETGDHDNETAPSANETENETGDNETGDHQGAPTGNETENETGENEGNETAPSFPEANETENESEMGFGNVSVEHNVTVTHLDTTTWVNGTLTVTQNGTALVTISFQVVSHDNGSANVTINETQTVGMTVVTVHGRAFYSPYDESVFVFGFVTGTQNGTIQWARMFAFEAPSSTSCSG